ncbi:MAG: chromo domain-containing protein, partial [Vulcanimicrobiaceae bacterium]
DTSYEVEKILDKRNVGRKVEYLVRWKKFGSNYDSWVDKKEMNCDRLIEQYENRNKESCTICGEEFINGREKRRHYFKCVNTS